MDTHRILKKDIKGQRFSIWPVREDGELIGVRLEPYADMPGKQSGIPQELEEDMKKYSKAIRGRNRTNIERGIY